MANHKKLEVLIQVRSMIFHCNYFSPFMKNGCIYQILQLRRGSFEKAGIRAWSPIEFMMTYLCCDSSFLPVPSCNTSHQIQIIGCLCQGAVTKPNYNVQLASLSFLCLGNSPQERLSARDVHPLHDGDQVENQGELGISSVAICCCFFLLKTELIER